MMAYITENECKPHTKCFTWVANYKSRVNLVCFLSLSKSRAFLIRCFAVITRLIEKTSDSSGRTIISPEAAFYQGIYTEEQLKRREDVPPPTKKMKKNSGENRQ